MSAYFQRISPTGYAATDLVGGTWNPADQHIAPALGLLVHEIELDRDRRRGDGLQVARVAYDIYGTMPLDTVDADVRVVRAGKTIELVEATLTHDGRVALVARCWLMRRYDTGQMTNSDGPTLTSPAEMEPWDPSTVWDGEFIRSVEVRRAEVRPGRASYWVRTPVDLIDGGEASKLARLAGLFDISNGMTVAISPDDVKFPNVDLTVHLHRTPTGEWLGFDTTVFIGPTGLGLTTSTLHDLNGPVGAVSQSLTVRPAM